VSTQRAEKKVYGILRNGWRSANAQHPKAQASVVHAHKSFEKRIRRHFFFFVGVVVVSVTTIIYSCPGIELSRKGTTKKKIIQDLYQHENIKSEGRKS
jgi:hypothetical protein